MASPDTAAKVYEVLTSDDHGRVCKDIPEQACNEQPRNFLIHAISLAATKTGDGLADPKLVLSWLLAALGAPAALVGLLVPLREAGALLPQLFTSARIRQIPQRKWAWAAGSFVQGLAVMGMGLSALFVEGAMAGWTILSLLAVFAVARSVCSVSYKDVLGKTIMTASRGTTTGTAATISAMVVLLFGVVISTGAIEKTATTIAVILLFAGALWMSAALLFTFLAEKPGATEGGGTPASVAIKQLSALRDDPQLRRFIFVRSLLVPTALAPPFLLALAGRDAGYGLGQLGFFVVGSSAAAVLSTYVWGRLSDISSRRVLMLSAGVATLTLGASAALSTSVPEVFNAPWVGAALLFALMIAYQGVRLGRSTHIVDMSSEDQRATYTALSNTVVGLVLVAGGVFGLVSQQYGETLVLTVFAGLTLSAAICAWQLEDVQTSS